MTDWTFAGTWPYEPRWFEEGSHFVQEDAHEIVVPELLAFLER